MDCIPTKELMGVSILHLLTRGDTSLMLTMVKGGGVGTQNRAKKIWRLNRGWNEM
jgi:hypothetical protein